jgi:hypothetical protein
LICQRHTHPDTTHGLFPTEPAKMSQASSRELPQDTASRDRNLTLTSHPSP